jgi:hypothetical protein
MGQRTDARVIQLVSSDSMGLDRGFGLTVTLDAHGRGDIIR